MAEVVILVGINQWEEFTRPAIRSIKAHDPDLQIVLVDNGSDPPYPEPKTDTEPYFLITTGERVCYAAAINAGMGWTDTFDWTVILNNDVIATGSIRESLAWMTQDTLWGNQLIIHKDMRWLGLWLFAIPREVRNEVGLFDENFEVCGFDDADYCFRAAKLGFRIEKSTLPVTHHWGKTRWGIPGYEGIRLKNKAYLEAKHNLKIGEQGDWRVFD